MVGLSGGGFDNQGHLVVGLNFTVVVDLNPIQLQSAVNFQGDGVANPLDFATVVNLAWHIDGNGSGLKEYSEKVLEFLSDACYTTLTGMTTYQ